MKNVLIIITKEMYFIMLLQFFPFYYNKNFFLQLSLLVSQLVNLLEKLIFRFFLILVLLTL